MKQGAKRILRTTYLPSCKMHCRAEKLVEELLPLILLVTNY